MLALILHSEATPIAIGSSSGMVDVGGNNHAAAGDFVAHQFGRELFVVRDEGHFLGDYALTGIVHLGEIAVRVVAACAARCHSARGLGTLLPLCRCRIAVRGSHDKASLLGIYRSRLYFRTGSARLLR